MQKQQGKIGVSKKQLIKAREQLALKGDEKLALNNSNTQKVGYNRQEKIACGAACENNKLENGKVSEKQDKAEGELFEQMQSVLVDDDFSFLMYASLTKKQASLVPPLTLAFVGDAVQALYVKTSFALSKDYKQRDLQVKSSKIVKAQTQAKLFDEVFSKLDEEAQKIALRARNAKTNNTPKNASSEEYHKATALEAVIGYLYLIGDAGKLKSILKQSIK